MAAVGGHPHSAYLAEREPVDGYTTGVLWPPLTEPRDDVQPAAVVETPAVQGNQPAAARESRKRKVANVVATFECDAAVAESTRQVQGTLPTRAPRLASTH